MSTDKTTNFDTMSLDELYDWAARHHYAYSPERLSLRKYVNLAIAARIARSRGNITDAKVHEDYMQKIYTNLPEHLKWGEK